MVCTVQLLRHHTYCSVTLSVDSQSDLRICLYIVMINTKIGFRWHCINTAHLQIPLDPLLPTEQEFRRLSAYDRAYSGLYHVLKICFQRAACITRRHLGFRWLGTLCMNYFSVVFVTRVNSISSSLPQGSHEIARRMRIIIAFHALTRYSHQVSIRERKLFLLSCDPLVQFDDSIEFQSNFNLQVSLV